MSSRTAADRDRPVASDGPTMKGENGGEQRSERRGLRTLTIGALGVVYGDLGTNILFALPVAFTGEHAFPATPPNVLGVLSLVFWALVLVLGVKYLSFIMRADNRGEGGVLALLSLVAAREPTSLRGRRRHVLIGIAFFGAALLYGDGIITPAISVLAAIEGLAIANPAWERIVVPVATGILIVLFLFQHRGTGRIGSVFGPVMIVWFATVAALGAGGILERPDVLLAVDPLHGVRFLLGHGPAGFLILGVVVLTVAGAEALYADMGHFGAKPIRIAWYGIVFPALVLNYFGQGAAILADPGVVRSPFYALVPQSLDYPVIALATAATIIASQSLISGAFSITHQAVQLDFLPRMSVRHTSATVPGRVYIPEVNTLLMVARVALVLGFRESSRLAAAYGMAVAGAMVTTSILFYVVTRERWRWGLFRAVGIACLFLVVDLAFFGANLVKIPSGAWIPLVIAIVVFTGMTTWRRGVEIIHAPLEPVAIDALLRTIEENRPVRVPGIGVFLSTRPQAVPRELMHYLSRIRTLHERVVLLSVLVTDVPRVADDERTDVQFLPRGLMQVTARYGFMESPDVVRVLERADVWTPATRDQVTFFIGDSAPLRTRRRSMAGWRKTLFEYLWRISRPAHDRLRVPADQIMVVGLEVEL